MNPFKLIALLGVWVIVSGFSWISSGPDSVLDPYWDTFDPLSVRKVDHGLWQMVLDDYLVEDDSGINLFDYEGLQGDADPRLDQYIESLRKIDPRALSKSEQMSYWINLYNALTVQLVVRNYPVESITELGQSIIFTGPWNDDIVEIAGKTLTLNDIEHRILRPVYKDHRIHFVVNCASIGCPNLASIVYTADSLEQLLSQSAEKFLSHPRGLMWQQDKLLLSRIFKWFQEDFGKNEKQMLIAISQYADAEDAARLRRFAGEVDYIYNWKLNGL